MQNLQTDIINNLRSYDLTIKDTRFICEYIKTLCDKAFAEGVKSTIEQYDPITGYDKFDNFICKFNSIKEASRILNLSEIRIEQTINDKSHFRNIYLKKST